MNTAVKLARIDLRGQQLSAAQLRAVLPRGGVDVDAVVPAADLAGAPGVPDPAKLDNPDGRIIQLSP